MHSREQCWPMVAQVERQAELMDRMMRILGVGGAVAARRDRGYGLAKARTECLNCSASHECQEWLETAKAMVPPPSFCPNAGFFREFTTARH